LITHWPEAYDKQNWIRTSENYKSICLNKYNFFLNLAFRKPNQTYCVLNIDCKFSTESVFLLQNVELPDSMSQEMKSLLEALLCRNVEDRVGCMGRG
jgi:hypothetical protein